MLTFEINWMKIEQRSVGQLLRVWCSTNTLTSRASTGDTHAASTAETETTTKLWIITMT